MTGGVARLPLFRSSTRRSASSEHRRKRLATLAHLFLIRCFKSSLVHYVTPNEGNIGQADGLAGLGILTNERSKS